MQTDGVACEEYFRSARKPVASREGTVVHFSQRVTKLIFTTRDTVTFKSARLITRLRSSFDGKIKISRSLSLFAPCQFTGRSIC